MKHRAHYEKAQRINAQAKHREAIAATGLSIWCRRGEHAACTGKVAVTRSRSILCKCSDCHRK